MSYNKNKGLKVREIDSDKEVDNIVFEAKEKEEEQFLFIFDNYESHSMLLLSVFAVAKTKEEAIEKIINRFVLDNDGDIYISEKTHLLRTFFSTENPEKIELNSSTASGGIISLNS